MAATAEQLYETQKQIDLSSFSHHNPNVGMIVVRVMPNTYSEHHQ